ncbi:alkaline phosphatase [Roseivirga sp. E12]|uniref:alkaline phosphatase n=1 Tax=Roseivirga sp. E12 TaxID=2819237 RepID=UPI001ABC3951|nr:alkaline phosphatase [Roseivirga sp. E12]MBO3699903.1 alkaline phosphatase [Roseivirga sp. E12]
MTKSIFSSLFIVILLLGCTTNEQEETRKAKHVILIGSDGLGAYAFDKAKIPNIRRMMSEGSYSLQARAVLPSSSAVNWASMIMGSGSELHGYTEWGSKTPELPSRIVGEEGIYPSIFSLIDEQLPEEKMGVSYTWGGIGYLFEKQLVDLDYNGKTDEETAETAIDFFVEKKPALTFIHFDQPDGAGHGIGHDTPEYYEAVEEIDRLVGLVMDAVEKAGMMDDTIIILSSDHGGVDKGHGGKSLLEVEIPWIIYGKAVSANGALSSSIVTYDTGSTIAYLLGLNQPQFWTGRPVMEVFQGNKE